MPQDIKDNMAQIDKRLKSAFKKTKASGSILQLLIME
jgi:hypothetical protein